MPTGGPYRNPSRSPSVDNITNHRYSTGSTASAGSSGTWSNRESIEHSTPVRNNLQQGQQQGGYEQEQQPPPHSSYPGDPSMAHSMDLPPPPPEMLHHGGHSPGIVPPSPTSRMNHHGVPSSPHYPQSPSGNGGYYNQFQFPASAGSSPSRQPFRNKPSFDDPPWLRSHQGRNRPPSGADYPEDHTANGQAMRGHLGGSGMMGHPSMHNNSMMHTHPAHSMDNMLASDFHCNDSQRPHSDGISDFHVDAISAQHDGIKDADRIYEWLRRQRLMEYTNNFTRSGYDMPTIAKMTPEDLTAIGITKPSHRKRITAMIAQMREADPVPGYIPGDVGTWLRLLDLSQYHNTLMTNSYGVMEEVFHITWEDLQDIGIDKLGHQKKIMLAVRRLKDLKKKGWVPGHQLNSDSGGSGSPQSSVDGITPLPAGFHLPLQERASPQSPQQEFANPPLARKHSGVRSSRESLSSDVSNRSAGSSSQDTTTPQDPHPPQMHLRHPKHHADASYVPSTASMPVGDDGKRTPSPKDTPKADPKNATEGNYSSFSTFRQPNANAPQTLPAQKAPQGIDKLIGMHKIEKSNRDSIGSASSFGSGSGSGSGDHSSLGSKKSLPPAPPRRTNSMITTVPDPEKLRTATIGRKKSMKPYHDRESAVAAGMARHPEITSGFATIKRTPSRKTDTIRRMQRSQSHDSEPLSAIASRSTEVIFKPPAAPSVPKVTPDMRVSAGSRVAPSDGQEDMNNSRIQPEQVPAMQGVMQIPYQMVETSVERTSPKQMHHQQSHNQIPNQMQNTIAQEVQRTSPKHMHRQQSHNQIQNQMQNTIAQEVQRTSPKHMHRQQSHNEIQNQMANAIAQEVQRTSPKQSQHHPAYQQAHHQVPSQMMNANAPQVPGTSPKHSHLQQVHKQIPNQSHDMNAAQAQRTSPKQTHNQVVRKDSSSSAVSMPSGVPTPFMIHQQDTAMHLQNAHNHHVQVQQQSRQDIAIPPPPSMNAQQDHSHYAVVNVPQSPRKSNDQPKNYLLSEQNQTGNYRPVVGTQAIEQAQNILSEAIESKQQGSTFPNGSYPHSKVHLRNEGNIDPLLTNASVWDQGRSESHTKSLSRNRAAEIERSLQSEKAANSYSFVMPPPSTATVLDSGRRASAASSENSSNSSEGSGQQRRPGSGEVLWKKQAQTDESAPVLQPVLSNPLQGIWRPKSRHQNRNSNAEIDEELSTDMSSSSKGSEEDSPIKTQATFLQLKKQFLNTDSHPLNYQTLKRPPKKPEPLAPEFRSRSRSFTEQDEFNQSPVSKYAPFSFETMNRNMNANSVGDDESSSHALYEEIGDRGMSSFNKSSPLTSPRHSASSQPQQPKPVPIPVVPVSVPQQPPVSIPQQPPYMQAPSLPAMGAVPPPPVGPPPAVPVVPKPAPLVTPEVSTQVEVQASPVRIPAPMSPAFPPPPPLSPMGPIAVSSAASPPMPPPPPAPIAVACPTPPPPPVPVVSQPPPPPPPPPPTDMQLSNLKQTKKAPALVPVNGKASNSAPKKPMGNIGGGVDMMAELKLRQKKRQKVPVVSESWESNSDTIKRKPASPNEMLNEELPAASNEAKQMPPPPPEHTASPLFVEVKKRAVPPVVLPKTRSPPKPSSKPQGTPTPPSSNTSSPRLIPIEDPMNRMVPIEEPKNRPVPIENPKSRLVPIEDPKDVDIFSSDMDKLEDHDDVVDSDGSESSDTLEISGFENENTDTIKKQPMRLSPRRQTAGESGSYGAEIITASVPQSSVERSTSSNKHGLPFEDAVSDAESLGEATLKLEEILRSMAMEDPLSDMMEDTWTPPPAPVLKLQPPPSQPSPPLPSPPPPPPPEPVTSEEPEEGKEVFNDIESMFANLALDLDSMMG